MHALLLLCLLQGEGLEELQQKLDFNVSVDTVTGRHELKGKGHRVVFAPEMDVVLVDGVARTLSGRVSVVSGRLVLPEDLRSLLTTLFQPRPQPVPKPRLETPRETPRVARDFKVVLDAGHGGVHTGCKSYTGRLVEKDVALDIVKRLATLLDRSGVKVTLTRSSDTELARNVDKDLRKRAELTNRTKPDIFVSVHLNTAANPSARGFEVYVPRKSSYKRESERLARCIQSEFSRRLRTNDRGVKEAGFVVIREARCPAVLVEVEFLSNPQGERDMSDANYRQRVAQALSDAVLKHAELRGQ